MANLKLISFTADTVIHFAAQQFTPTGIREIAIYQFPGDANWTLSRADADTDAELEEPNFAEDEEHATLYAAYTSVIQNHLSVPYPL